MGSSTNWDNEYRKLDTRVTQLRVGTGNGSNNEELKKLKEQIQVLLQITLEGGQVMSPEKKEEALTPAAELARRKSMLDSLSKRVSDLMARNSTAVTSNVRVNSAVGSSSQVKDAIRRQDDQLLTLSKGLTDLKQQSMRIGNETDMQVSLLDDMDQNMDDLESSMAYNLDHARRLKDETNYNTLYCWAAGLGALLFVQIMLKVSG